MVYYGVSTTLAPGHYYYAYQKILDGPPLSIGIYSAEKSMISPSSWPSLFWVSEAKEYSINRYDNHSI